MIGGGVDDKIVTRYEADVSQHRAAVESLRASQQALAADMVKQLEDQNKKLESHTAMWGKVAIGIGSVVAAVKLASNAWHAYVERANAEAATYGVSLAALRRASAGLKTDTELLNFAERQMSKDLALTRNEMELVLKAQVALARNGRDAAKVEEAVGEALTKNTVKPLREIGILLKQNEDPAKNFAQIMRALANAASDAGAAQEEVGENVQRAGVAVENAWSNLQVAAGRLIDRGLAPLTGWVERLAQKTADFLESSDSRGTAYALGMPAGFLTGGKDITEEQARRIREGVSIGEIWDKARRHEFASDSLGLAQWQGMVTQTLANMAGIQKDLAAVAVRTQTLRGMRKGDPGAAARARELYELTEWDRLVGANIGEGELGSIAGGGFGGSIGDFRGVLNAGQEEGSREARYGRFAARGAESKLEQIFGPIEEFNAYTKAWGLLAGSVQVAMDAWITGSMSAGAAIKKFLAESLRSLAIEMAVRALREGAEAAAAYAWGAIPAAVAHGKAAAMYGAAAIAAGVGARALGAGAGVTGPSASAAPTAAPTTTPAQQGSQIVVVYGDTFAWLTDRKRAQEARRIIGSAVEAAQGVSFS